MAGRDSKEEIRAFWTALYESLYEDVDRTLSRADLLKALDDLEAMFRYRDHLAVVEMPLRSLRGQRVLEIGPGAGGHSALFARHGARVTAIDLTPARARSTAAKFRLLGDLSEGCMALCGDAEHLPFPDGSFDIVYSNGVLHHTADTEKAIAEVYRVLRPGGRAVLMLYCKSSWHYWFNLVICVGILQGKLFASRNWVGHATEWGGKKQQTVSNPFTHCYTRRGIADLLSRFRDVTMRKGDFFFYLIPKLGRLWERYQRQRYGTHPGGILVYGAPWPIQSPLEFRLGRLMGFSWWISAVKPADDARHDP